MLREKNLILTKIYNRLPLDAERIVEEYLALAERLQPHVDRHRRRSCYEALRGRAST